MAVAAAAMAKVVPLEDLRDLTYQQLIVRLDACFNRARMVPILRELKRRYNAQGRRKRVPGMLPGWEEFCLEYLHTPPRTVRYWMQEEKPSTSGKDAPETCRKSAPILLHPSRTPVTLVAEQFNSTYPDSPPLVDYRRGHMAGIYGVWSLLPRPQTGRGIYGMYPSGFLPRALSLFHGATNILHCPSGTLANLPRGHVTVDIMDDDIRKPNVVADAAHLPKRWSGKFDLVLSDPPYSLADSKMYGVNERFPLGLFIREAHRVLRPGGFLAMLHLYYPNVPNAQWTRRALIAVTTGSQKQARLLSIFQKVQL